MLIALIALLYAGLPLSLQSAAKRYPWIDKVGVVTLCYLLGIVIGNIPGVDIPTSFANPVMSAAVMLSIPLLLFSSDFAVWRKMGAQLSLSFVFCILAVAIAVVVATWLFRNAVPDAWIAGSMLMGVYTGGTPNLTAIGLSLGIDNESLIVINGAEMLFGAIWLVVLLTVAKPLFVKLLRTRAEDESTVQFTLDDSIHWRQLPTGLGIAILIAGISVGISSLFFTSDAPAFNALVFLLVTTLGIGGSAIRFIKNLKGTFGLGNYLLLIFCVAIGSQADLEKIFGVSPSVLGFVATVMCLTIVLHLVFCLLFRIDTDTFIISSTAGIYGPPFIPPVARAIRNPYIIPVGLALGVLGLAVGNYLGVGISYFLRMIQ